MHDHPHSDHSDVKNLKLAFFLNLGFTIIELIGGLFTNSLAILSDALHDFGDSMSLGLAWYLQIVSKKGKTKKFTYGYRRFSLLGAIINSLVLIVGSIVILYRAIPRLMHPEEAQAEGMMVLAVLGIIVNGLAVMRLRKGKSINEKVVSLHLLEDVLGWVAVLIGAIVIYFTHWYIIDPILSLGIMLYVLYNIYHNIKESVEIILQAAPSSISIDKVEELILTVEGVTGSHEVHLWTLDGEKGILTAHILIHQDYKDKTASIKRKIKQLMLQHGIDHCTLELEMSMEECVELPI